MATSSARERVHTWAAAGGLQRLTAAVVQAQARNQPLAAAALRLYAELGTLILAHATLCAHLSTLTSPPGHSMGNGTVNQRSFPNLWTPALGDFPSDFFAGLRDLKSLKAVEGDNPMRTLAAVALAVTMLTGCSTYAASRYSISADNVRTLREYRGQHTSTSGHSLLLRVRQGSCAVASARSRRRMARALSSSCARRSSTS